MPRCVKEKNIREYFSKVFQQDDVKIFGYDWDGSVGDARWFVFDKTGNDCWLVFGYEGKDDFGISPADWDDWSYIGPGNSAGFFGCDFRGCSMGNYNFKGTEFNNCKFDEVPGVFGPYLKHTTFTKCEWNVKPLIGLSVS
jgi:hypothetical protein